MTIFGRGIKGRTLGLLVAGALLGVAAASPSFAAGDDFSDAQHLLFDNPQLQNISKPTTLTYAFRRTGTDGASFDDSVDLMVTEILPEGRRNLEFRFLTGERERPFRPIQGFRGNPLIMLFLQRDVEQMAARYGGAKTYFRNRIRSAIRDRAELDRISVDFAGQNLTVTRITISPFVGDPNRQRFADHEQKRYEFLLSPEVPGGIYQIRSLVPLADAAPLVEETMTYRGSNAP